MRSVGRRLHFQLMPLLDLLLIMIFSLYLEMVVREDQAEARIAASEQALEDRSTSARADLEAERRGLDAEKARVSAELNELRQHLEDVTEQQRVAGDLVAELFNVPKELVNEALKPLPAGAPPRPASETARLREEFQRLASLRGTDVVEHLLSYDELRKRADVWSIRIRANGEIVFSAGDRTQSFRASSASEFASRLFDRYKSLPQPKGLVVLLVSYGDARADVRQAVIDGLPEAVRLMREDRLGTTQFEYAVLGFLPQDERVP